MPKKNVDLKVISDAQAAFTAADKVARDAEDAFITAFKVADAIGVAEF